jgi:predicted ArsR family transcriptional regulator
VDDEQDLDQRVRSIAALDQPLRRALYGLLAQRDGWVTRDKASEALGLARPVAAFHLDKLADAGVVEVSFERPDGRTGPGAGRPAKLYRLRSEELAASVPDRRYDLAGSLLATAIAEAERTGASVGACLSTTARAAGRAIGTEATAATGSPATADGRRRAVLGVLGRHGYEPLLGPDGEIALTNCPFHRLAEEHRSLVCGMNVDFLTGLLEGMEPNGHLDARLAPEPGFCCVRVTAA